MDLAQRGFESRGHSSRLELRFWRRRALRPVFIYALCEPGTRTVRYIGKTIDPKKRLWDHLSVSRKKKTHLGNWLRSLSGAAPNFVILSEVPESEGSAEEIRYISAARTSLGMDLVNATDGGDGVTMTPEIRAKMSAASKGVPKSLEHRAALSAALKGVPKGPCPPERRASISATMTGVPHSPERCAAISTATKGVPKSPEFCAAVSVYQKGRPKSPEHRAALSAAKKGVPQSPEARAINSASHKGLPWSKTRRAAYEAQRKLKPSSL